MSIFPTEILLATDGSEQAQLAAQSAADIAGRTRSELHVVHVGEFLSTFFAHTEEEPIELQRGAKRLLDEEVAKIQATNNGEFANAHLRLGRADEQIIAVAEELGVGLIAMGSRGLGGIKRMLVGSVSDSVVRHAHCPVLVVRQNQEHRASVFPTKILLASDGSQDAELALGMAVGLANSTGSELHLITVCTTDPARYTTRGNPALLADTVRALRREGQEILDDQAKKIGEAGGSVREQHLRMGNAAKEIVVKAEETGAGLIAVGSRGRGGIRRALMGSVSDSVVRHASCPVLVVRPGNGASSSERFVQRVSTSS